MRIETYRTPFGPAAAISPGQREHEEAAITVGDAGEFGLIDRIVTRLAPDAADSEAVVLGPGDDAAVLRVSDGRVVASTDALVEGRHFRRDWSSADDIGHKAAAQAMADIAAMGGVPTGLLIALACPAATENSWVDDLLGGILAEAVAVGAVVIGGDVVAADSVTIAATALGDLRGRPPVTRAGAQDGDVVAVVGRLGWSAGGHAILSRGFRSPAAVVNSHRRPEPPYDEGPRAAAFGAHAMCDVSDGLVQDLRHIAQASLVRIELARDQIVVADRLREIAGAFGADPLVWVLEGGEDHALVATFDPQTSLPPEWAPIGRVVAGEPAVLLDGTPYEGPGFDHFR